MANDQETVRAWFELLNTYRDLYFFRRSNRNELGAIDPDDDCGCEESESVYENPQVIAVYLEWSRDFRQISNELAIMAEKMGVDSSPINAITGNLNGLAGVVCPLSVGEQEHADAWDSAWAVVKRLEGILAKRSGKAVSLDPLDREPNDDTPDGLNGELFTWKGTTVRVPGVRQKLLRLLWEAHGKKLPKESICNSIWPDGWEETKLTTTVNRLKNDLARVPWLPKLDAGGVVLTKRPE